jgi:hypothetical protein
MLLFFLHSLKIIIEDQSTLIHEARQMTELLFICGVETNPEDPDFQQFIKTDGFIFSVDGPRIADYTHVGMSVKLWIPKIAHPDKVYIYHRDGPGGCIGIVPSIYSDIIVDHLQDALDYDARIAELNHNICKIKCRLFSIKKTEGTKDKNNASLKIDLTEPYTPKNKTRKKRGGNMRLEDKRQQKLLRKVFNDLDWEEFGNPSEKYHGKIGLIFICPDSDDEDQDMVCIESRIAVARWDNDHEMWTTQEDGEKWSGPVGDVVAWSLLW